MSFPQVGGISFLTVNGAKNFKIQTRLKEITRENVDGQAYADLGKRGDPINWTLERDALDPVATQLSIEGLQGTLVSVVDVDGNAVANVMCIKSAVVNKERISGVVGGVESGGWMLTVNMTLQGTQ